MPRLWREAVVLGVVAVGLAVAGTSGATSPGAEHSRATRVQRPPSDLTVLLATRKTLTVSWRQRSDRERVTAYEVYLNGRLVAVTRLRIFPFLGLTCGTRYLIEVDTLGERRTRSARVGLRASTTSCLDTRPPTAPGELRATRRTASSIAVAWSASKDEIGVAKYELRRNGAAAGTATATSYTFNGLNCDQEYELDVVAVDTAGNRSPRSEVTADTEDCPDTTPPTAVTDLKITAATAISITVAWAPATDKVGVAKYELLLDGSPSGTATAPSFTFTGLVCDHSYKLQVVAVDAAGNRSPRSEVTGATAGCPDTTAPTMPGDLKVTGTTADTITVSWTASTDKVGVTTYDLSRGGASTGSTTGTSATFSWIPCGTSTTIEVTAVDAAGNRSTPASVAASTLPCFRAADRFASATGSDYRWTHLAATFDGSMLTIYVDGAAVSSSAVDGPLAPSTGPLRLGGGATIPEWFSGLMDDVRIYSRPLGAADIQADMNAPVSAASPAPDPVDLVAAYGFDGSAADVTGHGHDGALEGDAALVAGRSGGGVSFDGAAGRGRITIADAADLQLTHAMTLEAWVRPDRLGSAPSDWRAAIYKEQAPGSPDLAYALYAQSVESTYTGPSMRVYTTAEHEVHFGSALPQNDCASAAAPCLTLDRVYHAAAPGQVAELAAGAYGSQTIEPDATKAEGADVLIRPAAGATVTADDVVVDGAAHIELRGIHLGVLKTLQGTDHVTFRDMTAGMFWVDSSSNISFVGGAYGPSTDYDNGQIRPACAGCPHSKNILFDGVAFHDAVLSPGSVDHVECLQVWGTDHLTIRNSRFSNCEQHDVFFSGEGEPVSDVTFEQNFAGPVRSGFYSLRITASDPTEGCHNILFRYNSTGSPIGITCTTADNVRIVGNVGPLGAGLCDLRYTYSHNVWEGTACGLTDLNAPSRFVDASTNDLRLAPGAIAINEGDPADYPAADINGRRRPIGGAPDAGAAESG